MRISHIVWKELWHRKLGALMIVGGIALSVGLIVAVVRVSLASTDRVRLAMKEMGKNIIILPREVTLDQYWAGQFGEKVVPQFYVGRLAKASMMIARHYQGSLQRKMQIEGQDLILAGIMIEIDPQAPGVVTEEAQTEIARAETELGSEAAARLGLRNDGRLMLGPRPGLKVRKVRQPTGTPDDFKVFVNIDFARQLLGVKEDVVNVIEALSCQCAREDLPRKSKELENLLKEPGESEPRVRAHVLTSIAVGRLEMRTLTGQVAWVLGGAALLAGMGTIGAYSILNVSQRRKEMGILLAIAARPRHVTWMLLEKMLLLGAVGGVIGCLLGDMVAVRFGPPLTAALRPSLLLMYGGALALALALTLVPALVAVVIAARIDPAETLREL